MTQLRENLQAMYLSVINVYSSILFSEKRVVGILILLSTMIEPMTGITGLIGSVIALSVARLLGFEMWSSRSGILGFNSMLISLGIGYFMPNASFWGITYWGTLIGGSLITLLLFIGLNYITTTYLKMPSMSLSFSIVAVMLSFFVMRIGLSPIAQERFTFFTTDMLNSNLVGFYWKSLGSIFFQPYIISGILVMIALLITSRIGFSLTVLGFTLSYYLVSAFNTEYLESIGLYQMSYTSFNLMLIAMSIGGVFLIPSLTSYLIAIFACVFGFLITYSFQFLFENYYVAPYAFPMNITVTFIVIALRLRLQNSRPYIVDFGVMIPEDNLKYYHAKIKRFYQSGGPQFYLPFAGEWVITQGNNGDITHKLQWAYAWDFEMEDKDKSKFKGSGERVHDYYCYGKPVLATSDGWVVNTFDGIADNPIGQINTREKWGNFIVLNHGYGLYSLYCHLKTGSIKPKNGSWVQKGEKLGVVGNSGRSPVPHLHFNIQYGTEPGSATVKAFLVNFKKRVDGLKFKAFDIPEKGDLISSVVPVLYLQDILHLKVEDTSHFDVVIGEERFKEGWVVEVDLYGSFFIKSDRNATLEFSVYDGIFNVLSFKGNRKSALNAISLLLCRLPLYKNGEMEWGDVPPYSVVAKPFLENTLMMMQSLFKFSEVKNVSTSVADKDNVTIKSKTSLTLMKKSFLDYSGNVEIKELEGIKSIELQKNGKIIMQAQQIVPETDKR